MTNKIEKAVSYINSGNIEKLRSLQLTAEEINSPVVDPECKQNLLHFAASKESLEAIAVLLEQGGNIESKGKLGMTPLRIAVNNWNLEMVKFLLQEGAYANSHMHDPETGYTDSCIDEATRYGQTEILEALREYDNTPAPGSIVQSVVGEFKDVDTD